MKLSLLTYNLARSWDLTKIIQVARAEGFAGVEFRVEAGHEHGVELERTPDERRTIRERLEDAYLDIVGVGTGSRFESPDPAQRQLTIERTKRYIELASDLGSSRVRVFGNDIPKGVRREDCMTYVAECLRALGEFAEPFGVDMLLEMHGQLNYWGFARAVAKMADHPRVGLVYNSDPRDLVGGSVAATFSQVRPWIRHVHLHEFTRSFPYAELICLLRADGYAGYISAEIGSEAPTAEQYLELYAIAFRSWAGLPPAPASER